MKIPIKNYTFNKDARTITFNDYTTIDLSAILIITNVVDNIIIYNFANHLLGGTAAGNVLTLIYDTTGMSNSDGLQIFFEDGKSHATELTLSAIKDLVTLLQSNSDRDDDLARQLLQILKPLGIIVSGTGRLSLDVNSITTLPTLSTVTTVTNITNLPTLANVTTLATLSNQTNIGGLNALDQQYNIAHLAFAQSFRNAV